MKRNDFLKSCATGICGCGVLGWLAPLAAQDKNPGGPAAAVPDDYEQLKWQVEAARKRFAKLVSIMEDQLDGPTRSRILQSLGRECSQDYAPLFNKYRGDLQGFLAKIKAAWVERTDYDEKTGILRVIGKPNPCACPLAKSGLTPADFCTCTLGWQETAFSAVLGKPVSAEIEESVLRGSTRCSFRIKI